MSMHFYTRLAVLCLAANFASGAFGQVPRTNTATQPSLTPEAERQARDLLEQMMRRPLAPTTSKINTNSVERELARKRAEAEAQQRLQQQQQQQQKPQAPTTTAQPSAEPSREERERELQRIEAEVEKARKRREPAPGTVPTPGLRTPSPSAPAAASTAPAPEGTLPPDVQAQVRALLDQKTSELKGGTTAPPPTRSPAAPTRVVMPTTAPKSAPPPAAAVAPAPSTAAPASNLTPEQQARVRELLDQKAQELRTPAVTRPATPAPVVTAPAPVVAAPTPTPPARTPTPPPAITATPAPALKPTLTPEQEARIRELLDQKALELRTAPAQPAVTTVPVARPSTPSTTVAPATQAPATVTPPVTVQTPPPVITSDSAAQRDAEVRRLLDQKTAEVSGRPVPASPTVSVTPPATQPGTQPAQLLPGAQVSLTKAQRLAALLQAYRADAITPVQYHTERAKILAEP